MRYKFVNQILDIGKVYIIIAYDDSKSCIIHTYYYPFGFVLFIPIYYYGNLKVLLVSL